jgi:hypothetical protein
MKPPRQTSYRYETIEEYLDRGRTITRVPPSVARNYLDDRSLVGMLLGEPFAASLRTDTEVATELQEVRDVTRDARVTDADWN